MRLFFMHIYWIYWLLFVCIDNKIYGYKAPLLNRDNPCIQDNLLTLAGCMPNLRKTVKRGDIFIVFGSTKGGQISRILCIARVWRKISVKKYYLFAPKRGKNKYKVRRDNIYGIKESGKIFTMFKQERLIHDWCYYKNRIKQNIGDSYNKKVVLCKEYKTWFYRDGPKLSPDFEEYIRNKTKDIGIPRCFYKEIWQIFLAKRHIKEINPNSYNPSRPTSPRLLSHINKEDNKILNKEYDFDDIIQEIEATGGIKKTRLRRNAKRDGVDIVMSETIGLVSSYGNTFWSGTTIQKWNLLLMIVSYAEKTHNLILGKDYQAICMNKNFQCALHKDKNNIGYNYIIGGGNYSGGYLIVAGKYHDIKNKLLKFDPKSPHEVSSFTGDRYTLTFFTNKNYNK